MVFMIPCAWGSNKIILNQSAMVAAIQYYFDNVLFNEDVKVSEVGAAGNTANAEFHIVIENTEDVISSD